MLIAIDAVGIREGGGGAVLVELLTWLPKVRPDWQWHVFLFTENLRSFPNPPSAPNLFVEQTSRGNSGAARLLWINWFLPRRLQSLRVDGLLSLANIGPLATGVPNVTFCHQVLSLANIGPRAVRVPNVTFCHQPLVVSLEGHSQYGGYGRFRLRVLRFFVRRGLRASARAVVQTETMRKRLLELEPCLSDRIHVIPSGYRTPAFAPIIRPEKKSLIDSVGRPRLIYVSLFAKHKNHANLIAALPKIVENVPGATLMLTIEDDVRSNQVATHLFQRIRESVRQLGIEDRVICLGHLLPAEVEYALANSDLLVFPSLAESFGLGLVEAMAAGCPIAAADLPYAHDVAGPAAHYFNPDSPEAIAAAVVDLLGDAATIERLRREGQQRKGGFQYEKIARQFAHVIEEAMANPFRAGNP